MKAVRNKRGLNSEKNVQTDKELDKIKNDKAAQIADINRQTMVANQLCHKKLQI